MIDLSKKVTVLKEFSEFILPLSNEEFSQLERNLLAEGCREPLITWETTRGQLILIDGHNRFRICQKHNIPFSIKKIKFRNEEDVKLWMVDNQMGRRNLTEDQLSYYRGLKYLALRKERGGYSNVKAKGSKIETTSESLALKFNISESTIKRDAKFAEGLNIIGRSNPKLKNKILTGQTKVKKSDIQTLANAKNPDKISIRNEADLYNKANGIRSELLDEVESSLTTIQSKRIEAAQKALQESEPVFASKDDRIKRIKGKIISAINRAITKKDGEAIKELRKLIDRLVEEIF